MVTHSDPINGHCFKKILGSFLGFLFIKLTVNYEVSRFCGHNISDPIFGFADNPARVQPPDRIQSEDRGIVDHAKAGSIRPLAESESGHPIRKIPFDGRFVERIGVNGATEFGRVRLVQSYIFAEVCDSEKVIRL